MVFYYMASLQVGKITQIVHYDWLPERARWSHLPAQDYLLYLGRKISPKAM